MDNNTRKSDIGFMTIVASLAHQVNEADGICAVGTHLDSRKFYLGEGPLEYKPGVHMQAKTFLEYFGDDTEFEYVTDKYGTEMRTEVNGVVFYALVSSTDRIESGAVA